MRRAKCVNMARGNNENIQDESHAMAIGVARHVDERRAAGGGAGFAGEYGTQRLRSGHVAADRGRPCGLDEGGGLSAAAHVDLHRLVAERRPALLDRRLLRERHARCRRKRGRAGRESRGCARRAATQHSPRVVVAVAGARSRCLTQPLFQTSYRRPRWIFVGCVSRSQQDGGGHRRTCGERMGRRPRLGCARQARAGVRGEWRRECNGLVDRRAVSLLTRRMRAGARDTGMRTMIRRLGWGVLAVILVACGGGSGDLPPVRPSSVVSGNAVDAEIQIGQVTIYAFGRSGKGERLGGGVTDARGFYSIELRAPSQPVLIEVSGGRYTEEASGVAVDVGEGQVLRAVAHYVSGQPLSLMVTPLTQLAAGLAEYQIMHNTKTRTAVDVALASMNNLFGLAVSDVVPRNTCAAGGATDQLSAPYIYGFFLAALSSFTQWASQQNNVPTHTVYTSVSLAQVMYNDIRSDGLLV